MPRAESTSNPSITECLSSTIDYLPGAILVVDGNGCIRQQNRQAASLLALPSANGSLLDVVASPEFLKQQLAVALRTSATLPFSMKTTGQSRHLSGSIRSLPAGSGAPSLVLISCHEQGSASYKMRMLNKQLQGALEKQQQLRRRNRELQRKVDVTLPKLREQSIRDPLTGVYNRRFFDQRLAKEWHRATRNGSDMSVMYVDIDQFKKFNDALGHAAGDSCLQAVAQALTGAITREFDSVSRIGGEEFALLLPMTDEKGSETVARRALQSIRDLEIGHPQTMNGLLTVSVGVGTCTPNRADDTERFLAAVDRALYAAKSAGRNRMCAVDFDWRQTGDGPVRAEIPHSG